MPSAAPELSFASRLFNKTMGFVATKKMKLLSGNPDGVDLLVRILL